ncbi:type IV pili methyl-accepting chemotaxis transducer N-terminal domain-containing protein [Muricauda oceani]|uniref:histidine kinase n=1 Tax=Flagellimonas oceani TaxID=2698672 RepID=A0A6G7J0M9_9FLAO|nr:type IV pili methyl-accepting chemotaxis transducer N-terminal domain-containing protein [Allomuricauda oceani]MBW8243630.1 type IV pili methyl-accepting chemotaxis transducer N-terminal domain-containing protein [Allomuricauda oceani]QII44002.1 PAS domain-containing protein [Allomuricauda oceani]
MAEVNNTKNQQQNLDVSTFQRFRKWYLLALSAIALTIIVAQILIQQHLNSQLNDSRVINVAGRQRAYSQKLVKEALLLQSGELSKNERQELLLRLDNTLLVWKTSHDGLQNGNDSIGLPKEDNPSILKHFQELSPHHDAMVNAVENMLKHEDSTLHEQELAILLANEGPFLDKMDTIVNEYDAISKERLQRLKFKEYLLLAFSLLILVLEVFFIFRPLSIQIKEIIQKLVKSRLRSEQDAQEIKKIFQEKEKSLQELKELNFVIDNAALFASARSDGTVVFISKKFLSLLESPDIPPNAQLAEILTKDEGQRQYLNEVLTKPRKSIRSEEIEITTNSGNKLWMDLSIIPMHRTSLRQSVLILCSDITERKRNQEKVEQLTRENYEDRVHQKQMQASLIVEGQEEERKRIAKDIHDGIGQMLTALRFNIESINLDQKERSREKIEYLKSLTGDLIKGVRTATFNLTPPELSDHGIFPALQKMTSELSKLTGQHILFENKAEENIRFDSLAETNIYRVTQEAVNNAIKYADASYILVTINHTDSLLSVVIDDDGKGFDPEILDKPPKNSSDGGMGVFFMKERMSYINGRLFIRSRPGEGTRVTINYNLTDNKIAKNEPYED